MASERVKVTFAFSPEVIDALRYMARERDITVTEVVRQAISTEKFLFDAIAGGEKILLRKGRHTRELILR
jgi:hypothetical protein